MNDIIPEIKTSDIVNAYTAMNTELDNALDAIERMQKTCSHYFKYGVTIDFRYPHRDSEHKKILTHCWRQLFYTIKNFLPEREIREHESQIERGEVPPFTEENINKILYGFVTRGEEFKKIMIEDTFDFLRPQYTGYKTNKRTALTEKAIITWCIDRYGHFNYHKENYIFDMDKIFHLLDGAGMPEYPGNLVTKIKDAIRERKKGAETEYFSCKWFLNGNMHIKFKRMDLVREINKIAGCNKLAT